MSQEMTRPPDLRRGAEERIPADAVPPTDDAASLSPEEVRRTLHELRGHQIELEQQNEELRRMQMELDTSRARYVDLYDLAPVGYVTLSEHGLILEANLTVASLLGLARTELAKQPLSRFVFKDDHDIDYLHRKQLFKSREPQPYDVRLVKKDGTIVWAHIAAVNSQDAVGERVCRMTLTDITDRKRVEESLRESEGHYRRLFETMAQGVVYQAADGHIVSANPSAERILGLSLDQMRGRTSMDPGWRAIRQDGSELPGQDHPSMVALRTGQPVERFIMGVSNPQVRDVVWILVSATPLFEPGGTTPFQVFTTFDDITAQRKAEQDFRTLFREMLDGFALHEMIWDEAGEPLDYRFLAVNPAFERMTGLQADALVGRTVLEALPGIERHWIETYGQVARTGEPAFFENYSADLKRYFEVTAFQPAPNQFACIFADITERKLADEERTRLRARLQQDEKMEFIGRLAGGVAHDFNNMLGVILGHTEMAIEEVTPGQPLHADLEEIRKAATRSADLTRQLLAFARKQTVSPRVLDLNETVADTLRMLGRLIGEDIRLTWEPGANLWPVKIDPAQVDQILANLCVNARDAIAGVGTITVATANVVDEADWTDVADPVPGEYVRVTVSDTGRGMNSETLSHLFEPFFTTKGVGEGTGMGLASVGGAVEQNGGVIRVRSELGAGTTFRIYLPRHVGHLAQAQAGGSVGLAVRGHETILLVEDEPAILSLTTTMLERQGCTVLAAGTPGDAIRLAMAHAGPIHLLMTDVVMPEMNGMALARQLQSIHPHLKRLFMSGYTADVIADHGVVDERVSFIQKPFSIKDLAAKVREALDQE